MKIYLATDHAGFELKEKVKSELLKMGLSVEDYGALNFDKNDDYPDFISKVGEAISKNPEDKGIIFGGSGQGEMILANKYKNVRCTLFYSPKSPVSAIDASDTQSNNPYEVVRLMRLHNNSNILSLGARFLKTDEAITAVKIWLETAFSDEERHIGRIAKISQLEGSNKI